MTRSKIPRKQGVNPWGATLYPPSRPPPKVHPKQLWNWDNLNVETQAAIWLIGAIMAIGLVVGGSIMLPTLTSWLSLILVVCGALYGFGNLSFSR